MQWPHPQLEYLEWYVIGWLDSNEDKQVSQHLAECAWCLDMTEKLQYEIDGIREKLRTNPLDQ